MYDNQSLAESAFYSITANQALTHNEFCRAVEYVDRALFKSYGYFASIPASEFIEEMKPYLGRDEERRRKFYRFAPILTFCLGMCVGVTVKNHFHICCNATASQS